MADCATSGEPETMCTSNLVVEGSLNIGSLGARPDSYIILSVRTELLTTALSLWVRPRGGRGGDERGREGGKEGRWEGEMRETAWKIRICSVKLESRTL